MLNRDGLDKVQSVSYQSNSISIPSPVQSHTKFNVPPFAIAQHFSVPSFIFFQDLVFCCRMEWLWVQ